MLERHSSSVKKPLDAPCFHVTVAPSMHSESDIQYALDMTKVLHEPDRRIDTFGNTQFEFQLVSELMDEVDQVRVRQGRIEAQKPVILRPDGLAGFDFEGFGPEAEKFGSWLKENLHRIAFFQYGFHFKKSDVSEEIVHESMENVCGKLVADTRSTGNPMRAVIQGVDDAWEVCLLKFTVEMIAKSRGINEFDFKRRGLI